MKREIGIRQPDFLVEDWPGKYEVFSWLEYVVTVPNPIYIVTTRKANGAPNANLQSWGLLIANANLQSWGLLIGESGNYSSLLALMDQSHTYANIQREGDWCVNFPSFEHYPECFETIYCNAPDNDEITQAGFTVETAKTVLAPRIAECPISLECRLEWQRPLYEGSNLHLLVGRVLHLAMDEAVMVPEPVERMAAMRLMYNVRSTVNPLNGEQYGPNTLGLLSKVEKIFTDEGRSKGWRVQGDV
jgi:flavin reductase (DIM6/NTAB) family NADH-FMN oxidoreductase RutF